VPAFDPGVPYTLAGSIVVAAIAGDFFEVETTGSPLYRISGATTSYWFSIIQVG
jgi:hypothetical protein